MQSVVVQAPEQLAIEQRESPQPLAHEVRVKVISAGICGSDVHIWRGHNPFARYPRVIGHEFLGVIDAVGEAIAPTRLGERVVVDPVVSCGSCYPCSIGRPNVCVQLQVIGVHRDGGFSESVCVPAQNAYQVPDELSHPAATLIEPFSIAANVCNQLLPTPRDSALIYGAGPMGLMALQALKGVYGVKHVVVTDRIDERLVMAQQNGADDVVNPSQQDLRIFFARHGIQPTLIIDAACHPAILPEALALASPAARIAILGFSSEPCVINQQVITSKQLTLFSSRLNGHCFPQVIAWMQQRQVDPERLITHHFPYQQVQKALEIFEKDQQQCCKVLLHFPRND